MTEEAAAAAALQHYAQILPNKGKPTHNNERREWTVFAAIVAKSRASARCWVVSSATGTKCCAAPAHSWKSSRVLHDCHAEVVARRGLVRVLWKEIQALTTGAAKSRTDDFLLERCTGAGAPSFQMKKAIELHMYVSDSPCGDASIYRVEPLGKTAEEDYAGDHETTAQFTGAKVVVSTDTNVNVATCEGTIIESSQVAREGSFQLLGKLRTKSGRSNLCTENRSCSMSCSDKLVRWNVLGLQGTKLSSSLLPEPIRLASCIVSRDPRSRREHENDQLGALNRSIKQRTAQAAESLKLTASPDIMAFADSIVVPDVHTVDTVFPFGKAVMEEHRETKSGGKKRKREERAQTFPASGFSVNWNQSDQVAELTIGARGVRQGKKPKSEDDYVALESRLCRDRLQQIAVDHEQREEKGVPKSSYGEWKSSAARSLNQRVRDELFRKGPLAGWIVGDGARSS